MIRNCDASIIQKSNKRGWGKEGKRGKGGFRGDWGIGVIRGWGDFDPKDQI